MFVVSSFSKQQFLGGKSRCTEDKEKGSQVDGLAGGLRTWPVQAKELLAVTSIQGHWLCACALGAAGERMRVVSHGGGIRVVGDAT